MPWEKAVSTFLRSLSQGFLFFVVNFAIFKSFCSGVFGVVIQTKRRPVSQFVNCPSLFLANSFFFSADCSSQPTFVRAVSICLSSQLMGTLDTYTFVAGFSSSPFWSLMIRGFLSSREICTPHSSIPSSKSFSVPSLFLG